MANLKAIRKRIQGVTGTQQLTRAMKLVAAAKLRRAQEAALAQRAYSAALMDVISHLAGGLEEDSHPLLKRREMKKTLVLMMTSDRGLCGAFNLNICRTTDHFIEEKEAEGVEVVVSVIGKKGNEHLRREGVVPVSYYDDLFADTSYGSAARIGNELSKQYVDGDFDGLYVVFNYFRSAAVQRVTLTQVLPVQVDVPELGDESCIEHVFEPDKRSLLDTLFPMFVNVQLYQSLLESVASEMGARMTAMDNATNNAQDLVKRLTLAYNKARQEAITTELMDIVGGAEALK
jgi:F-type H+-transporting ATPase subunit gamma